MIIHLWCYVWSFFSEGMLLRLQISTCALCRPDNDMVRVIKPSMIWFARRKEAKLVFLFFFFFFFVHSIEMNDWNVANVGYFAA